jgi:hypothetical protein
MKIFAKKLSGRILASTSGLVALFLLGSTNIAYAAAGGAANPLNWLATIGSFTAKAIATLLFDAVYMIAWVFGVFISVEAWLLSIVLNINTGIFETAFVQSGFSVSLSIANLAFVAGIIVIAIATIIRNETYGVKKLLWKLVVAAVLVNFGLVIAAPIVGMTDSLTQYFLNCINPGTGCAQSTSGDSYSQFAQTLTAVFQPQNSFTIITSSSTKTSGQIATTGGVQAINKNLDGALSPGGTVGNVLVALGGMVISLFNVLLIVVIMGALAVLFLIRYIYISILAILMPFAWASWVFPAFGNHWKKWWDQFLRWAFFAPISIFFIYLAMLLMQAGSSGFDIKKYENSLTAYGAISNFFGSALAPVLGAFVQEIIFGGLIVGGLIAANAMGLKGAKAVTATAKGTTKSVAAWSGKKAWRPIRGVGDRIRTMGTKYDPTTKETTTFGQRLGSRLPFGGSMLANYTAHKTIQKEREDEVKKYIETNLKNLPKAGIKRIALAPGAFIDPVKSAGIAQVLAEKGMTNDPEIAKLMPRYLASAQRLGTAEAVFKSRPDLVPIRAGESPEAAIARGIRGAKGDVTKTTPEIFKYHDAANALPKLGLKNSAGKALDARDPADVAQAKSIMQMATLSLSPAQLQAIGSDEEGDERRQAIIDSVKKIIEDYGLATGPAGHRRLDTAALNTLIGTLPSEQQKAFRNLEAMVKHIEKSGNWTSPFS